MMEIKKEFTTLILILGLVVISEAAGLAPKKASNLVTLATTGGCLLPQLAVASQFTTRNLPDGSSVPFTIPNGQVLIVTDVDWTANSGAGNLPRTEQAILLLVTNTSITGLGENVATGITQAVGGSFHFTNGVVVAPNTSLCIGLTSNNTVAAFLQGYLASDK